VLAEIRNARQARERARAAAAAPAPETRNPGAGKGGAFTQMEDEINSNLKKMVVGSSLNFEEETTVKLIRTIGADFAVIGTYAAEKNANAMIEAGKNASKVLKGIARVGLFFHGCVFSTSRSW
jgi:hypothetical protein